MALRIVGDPRTVVLVLGPQGRVVGHVLVDLHTYKIDDPVAEGDLRPYIINCRDGIILVVHRESARRASYLRLSPAAIFKDAAFTTAFRMPCTEMNVRDYVADMERLNREALEERGRRKRAARRRTVATEINTPANEQGCSEPPDRGAKRLLN